MKVVPQLYKQWSVVTTSEEVSHGQRCLQFVFECVPKERLVPVVVAGLKHAKHNVQQAVLQGVVEAVDRLGDEMADPLAASDVVMALLMKLVEEGMGKVRDTIPMVVRVLARGRHREMLEYVNAAGLRREGKAILTKAIQLAESEGESVGGKRSAEFEAALAIEALGDSVATGSGGGGGGASSSNTTGSGGGGTGGIVLSLSTGSITRSVSSSNLATSSATPVHVDTDDQLKRELTKVRDQLTKTDKNEWQSLVAQLKYLQGVIIGGGTLKTFLEQFSTMLTPKLKDIMKIDRAQVVEELNRTLCVLAVKMGHSASSYFKGLMPLLIEKIDAGATIVTGLYDTSIATAIAHTTPDIGKKLAEFLLVGKEKNAVGRGRIVLYIQQIIVTGSAEYADPYASMFGDALKRALSDAVAQNRAYARQAYAEYGKRWFDKGLVIWNSLEPSVQNALTQHGIDLSKTAQTLAQPTTTPSPSPPLPPPPTPLHIFDGLYEPTPAFNPNNSLLAPDRAAQNQGSSNKLYASTGEIPVGPHSSPVHPKDLSASGDIPIPPESKNLNKEKETRSGGTTTATTTKAKDHVASNKASTSTGAGGSALRVKPAKAASTQGKTSTGTGATRLHAAASSSNTNTNNASAAKTAQRGVKPAASAAAVVAELPNQTPRKVASVSVLSSTNTKTTTFTQDNGATVPPSSISKSLSANGLMHSKSNNSVNSQTDAASSGPSSVPSSPSKPLNNKGSVDFPGTFRSENDDGVAAGGAGESGSESNSPSTNSAYYASSSDTTEFRNILKRCAASDIDIEERTKAMESLRQLMRTDSLPGLWGNTTLLPQFAKTIASRLLDSQARVLQASLDILDLVATEHQTVFESIFETLSHPLFLVAFAASSREEYRSSSQGYLSLVASSNPNTFVLLALKAIAIPDAKLRLSTVRSLDHCITMCGSYFERQPKRIESFIQQLAVKPNNVNSSIDMTKSVYDLFGKLYQMLGESFAVPLRVAKFNGLDNLMKKHKIPLKPSAAAASSSNALAKPAANPNPKKPLPMNVAPSSAAANGSKLRTVTSASQVVPSASNGPASTNVHRHQTAQGGNISVRHVAPGGKVRPVLVKQKSLGALPSGKVLLQPSSAAAADDAANDDASASNEAVRHALALEKAARAALCPSPNSSMVDTTIMPPSTPSAERVREMRNEIAQTPNVLITVLSHPSVISPLTSNLRNGTPTLCALGRSTSTPQFRSLKASGRVMDVESSGGNAMDPFSPVKFKLDDCDDEEGENIFGTAGSSTTPNRSPSALTELANSLKSAFSQANPADLSDPKWPVVEERLDLIVRLIASKTLSADSVLYTLNHEGLLENLRGCMDRGIKAIGVRQRACKVLNSASVVLPTSDWDSIFATLPANLQHLLKSFMEARATLAKKVPSTSS